MWKCAIFLTAVTSVWDPPEGIRGATSLPTQLVGKLEPGAQPSFVQEELKCFHPINWKSIAGTYRTEAGVKDAAACQRLCSKEDQCTHFNYHTDSHNCELKVKNGSDVVQAANVITGPKTCSSSCFTLGVGHTARELAKPEKKYSPYDCQSWCRDTNGCEYFTFNVTSSTCFLKGADAAGTERPYPGDMIGPKEFCSGGNEDAEIEEEPESGTSVDGEGGAAAPEGEEELKCFHPVNWKSIAGTYRTEAGVKDAAACQRLCSKEDQCTHFNYHTDSHNCELKVKNGSDVVQAANVITGPKTCSSSCFTLGVGHTARELAKPEKKYSPYDCQSWCRDTNGCEYFTFNVTSSTCFLKGADAAGTERPYPGDMIGPKEFCSGGNEDAEIEEEPESGTSVDGEGGAAAPEGEEELKCFHPVNWKSIAGTYRTEAGVKDAAACQRLCSKEDQCTHFNYHTDSHNCELKVKNGSDVVQAANVITGPKTCSSSCFTLGVGHTARELAKPEKKYSPYDCQSWCRDTNGCEYFTFNVTSSTCFLKGADAAGTERPYPGDMIGPKEFCSGGNEDAEIEEEPESGTSVDGEGGAAAPEGEGGEGGEAAPEQVGPGEQAPIPGSSPDVGHGEEDLLPPVPELEEGSGSGGSEVDKPGQILPSRYPAAIPDTGLSSKLVCMHPRHRTTTADIHKSLTGIPTPEDCHLACWHENECTHFTYNLTTGRCDLRANDSSHVTEEANHITGPKTCNSSCFTVGKGHSAHNIAPITEKYSAFDCQSWCRQNSKCMYFTYNRVTKKCYLKGSDAPNTLSPSVNDVVGPRDFCPP
ncbi:unnamed protein product [Neospora caninum Liverpool]|uniref:PAN domain-containing protein n=1 Tax=Neospora caninum (strain Liverpool) TaxID=572307 RepID=F0V892_NEOCL|nr:uncharacterized protein NCLIV_004170 [Neospora caninum Liverpool]CBZ49933.1 unnamed protein product [Neospora caninum Liverpool]CEL64520.1 TPA: PAN domain-containing protein [Neospora caninum Liverpool]|eukprot:XP_003879968.1 uncharacterized protein NCLIV_004170 [Neospora caninum Liverpool]